MRFRFVCNRFIILYYSAFHLKFQWAVWMAWCRLGSKEHKIVPLTYDFLLTFSLSSHIFILCHQSVPGMSSVACLIALWNIGNGMNCRWLNNLFRCGLSSLGRLQVHVERGWEILYKFSSDFLPRPFFLRLVLSSLTAEDVSNVARTGWKDGNGWSKQRLVCVISRQRMQQLLLKHRKQFLSVELFLQIDLVLLNKILVGRVGSLCWTTGFESGEPQF